MKDKKNFSLYPFWCLVFTLVLCPAVFAAGLSPEEVWNIISQTADVPVSPDADAVILFREITEEIPDAFHRTTTEEVLLKIITGQGKHTYGDVKITYNILHDNVEVLTAETYTCDGKRLPLMEGADNTIVPPELMDATVYNAVKQRVLSLSDVEPGAVLHWKTRIRTAYPEKNRFIWKDIPFRELTPILRDRYTLTYSDSCSMTYRCLNGLKPPSVQKENHRISLTWNRKDVPMISTEWGMSDLRSFSPRFVYSTAGSWNVVASRFRSDFFLDTDEACNRLKPFTESLLSGKTYSRARLDAVYRWVADNVRTIYMPLGDRDFRPTDPAEVRMNMYGDALDKSKLLVCLLRLAGFKAYPVLFPVDRFNIPESVPGLMDFNSIGVVIYENDAEPCLWLDPSEKNIRAGYFPYGQGSTALIIRDTDHKLTHVPEFPCRVSESRQCLSISLQEDGSLSGTFRWNGTGHFDMSARKYMRSLPPGKRKMRLDRMLNTEQFPAEILDWKECDWKDFSENAWIEATLNIPGYAILEDTIMIVVLPEQLLPFSFLHFPSGRKERNYPLELRSAGCEQTSISLSIPNGYRLIYKPEASQRTDDLISMEQSSEQTGNQVTVNRLWCWKKQDISPAAFKHVKKWHDTFHRLNNVVLLLEKENFAQ